MAFLDHDERQRLAKSFQDRRREFVQEANKDLKTLRESLRESAQRKKEVQPPKPQ